MEWNQLLIWENLIIFKIKLERKCGLYRGKYQFRWNYFYFTQKFTVCKVMVVYYQVIVVYFQVAVVYYPFVNR